MYPELGQIALILALLLAVLLSVVPLVGSVTGRDQLLACVLYRSDAGEE